MRLLPAALLCLAAPAQDIAVVDHWAYDSKAPLEVKEVATERRGTVAIQDLSFASPKGDRVTAYLVVPDGKGPSPAVLWGHWYWENSDFRNRKEFLDEAVLLASRGVLSLLPDGPIARPGYHADRTPMNEWQFEDLVHAAVDMRRGIDLLLARGADPTRIGYVGHSYNASVGAILSGVDRRPAAFVLMAGSLWDEVDLKTKAYLDHRQRVGPEKWDAFVATHTWADPGRYVSQAAPAAVLMQFATQEDFLTPDLARQYAAHVSEPKQLRLYEALHALNAEARRDRIAFLAERLGFEAPSREAIARVPELPQPPLPKP